MKAVILAGGLGSRLSEETHLRPKPMVEVGGRPMIWHVMKVFAAYGITDFLVCLGYKGYVIKEYFANYALHTADVTFDFATGTTDLHDSTTEPWRVTLVDTGELTQTGGRLRRVLPHLAREEAFFFTYGDGVSDVDLTAVAAAHREHGRLATMTAVQPPGRFGALDLDGDEITGFREKPRGDGGWVNGGFFVLSPGVSRYLAGDDTIWEREPLERLAAEGQIAAYRHDGFWRAMDTQRDRRDLEELWRTGQAPWKVWE